MADRLISGAGPADGIDVIVRRSAALVGLGVLGLVFGALAVLIPAGAAWTGMGAGLCAIGTSVLARREIVNVLKRRSPEEDKLHDHISLLERRIKELEVGSNSGANNNSSENYGGASTSLRSSADQADALTDRLTGLFSEGYFKVALDARIAAARRRLRPVSVVLVDVVQALNTPTQERGDPIAVTTAIRATLREADTAARLGDGRFALVLEDTPENGAIWTIERLRSELVQDRPDHTVWAGVACYPAHAFDTGEILTQADQALEQAREWHQDRIEIANTD